MEVTQRFDDLLKEKNNDRSRKNFRNSTLTYTLTASV